MYLSAGPLGNCRSPRTWFREQARLTSEGRRSGRCQRPATGLTTRKIKPDRKFTKTRLCCFLFFLNKPESINAWIGVAFCHLIWCVPTWAFKQRIVTPSWLGYVRKKNVLGKPSRHWRYESFASLGTVGTLLSESDFTLHHSICDPPIKTDRINSFQQLD